MSKLANLQAQLEKQAAGRGPVHTSSTASEEREPPPPHSPKPPSRIGKIHIGAYLFPDFKRSLRLVQAETGEDTQTLLARALNDLFRSHNVPVIGDD